ncbi:MAG: acyl-CoA dehydratase activase [Thermodesulfobacteriota bacterium]|nr:acyl-CoA dehydratase activase [Thermodesulfobacteriota bacterium]
MSYFAGIDIGSLCTKAVIINSDGKIVSYSIIRSGAAYKGAGEEVLNDALLRAGLKHDDVLYTISTGYGRARVPIADGQVTEITCHARGANHVFPEAGAVIDIGGQDSKVIEIGDDGRVLKFVMNDKCAAGTGRFLEVMAGTLEADLDEMSEFALKSKRDVEISSMCTVFAESEVISLFAEGAEKVDIASGIYRSIARRVTGLASQIVKGKKVTMTGGVAKSKGMVKALEKNLGTLLLVADEPQIIGALGAALIAKTKFDLQ